MKHNSLIIAALAVIATACGTGSKTSDDGLCHIHGTIPEKWNGVRVFLVPTSGPATAETVDSTVIEDGRFEFVKDTMGLYDLRVDYRHRLGLQQLVVVTEPGDVYADLGSWSSARGTEQNDSLQVWKEWTEKKQAGFVALKDSLKSVGVSGDAMKLEIEAFREKNRVRDREFYNNLKPCLLKDELKRNYGSRFE